MIEALISTELILPISAPGDDIAICCRRTSTPAQAMRMYASRLREAAQQVEDVADAIAGSDMTVHGDGDSIGLCGPIDVLGPLIDADLLEVDDIYIDDELEETDEE